MYLMYSEAVTSTFFQYNFHICSLTTSIKFFQFFQFFQLKFQAKQHIFDQIMFAYM